MSKMTKYVYIAIMLAVLTLSIIAAVWTVIDQLIIAGNPEFKRHVEGIERALENIKRMQKEE